MELVHFLSLLLLLCRAVRKPCTGFSSENDSEDVVNFTASLFVSGPSFCFHHSGGSSLPSVWARELSQQRAEKPQCDLRLQGTRNAAELLLPGPGQCPVKGQAWPSPQRSALSSKMGTPALATPDSGSSAQQLTLSWQTLRPSLRVGSCRSYAGEGDGSCVQP